jgi:hypothetical protein
MSVPLVESLLCLVSFASTVASIRTGHYVATPFAALFTAGYGYMAGKMLLEQMDRVRPVPVTAPEGEAVLEELAAE